MIIVRRLRIVIALALFSLSLVIAANPVFAAAKGKSDNSGSVALPEAPVGALLPIGGLVVTGVVLAVFYMGHHSQRTVVE